MPENILHTYAKEVHSNKNMRRVANDADGMVYEIDGVQGNGTVEILSLFPGMFLQFHHFRCQSFRIPSENNLHHGLKISFCFEGRAEIKMSDDVYLFMEPGILSIDHRTPQDFFRFPSGHYRGIELFFHRDALEAPLPQLFQHLSVDPNHIKEYFCLDGENYSVYADERFKTLFSAMADAPIDGRTDYLRIKIMELLFLLDNSSLPRKSKAGSFMTVGQMEIAKQVQEIITQDLTKHHAIERLAKNFAISPSSVKNYFQKVYGKNISTYLREVRMAKAVKELTETTKPVAEIATLVGYESASKFSAAFKNFFGETPLEYRRQSRCGI